MNTDILQGVYGNLYGYQVDCSGSGVGIVIADDVESARQKVMRVYLERGYQKNGLSDMEIWEIDDNNCSADVLEIY